MIYMANTAEYIIETIAPIFNRKGYVGTSLSDLTKATNLTKGALYGNFANKEELAIESFRYNVKQALAPLFEQVRRHDHAVGKLLSIVRYYRSYYETAKERGGCPVLNVGVDAKHNHPKLFEAARSETTKLIYGLRTILENGIAKEELNPNINPESTAKNIYSMIEGGIFMTFTHDDESFLQNILDHVETLVNKELKQQ